MTTTAIIRTILALAAAGLLAWGLLAERHHVASLADATAREAGGIAFTEDATVDGYVRIKGELFDAYTPLTPGQVQLKDCKT